MVTSDTVVVCDAGPLIHLGELGAADLLSGFGAILVPEQVWDEVARHFPTILTTTNIELVRLSVQLASDARFRALVQAFALDLGEQAALSLVQNYSNAILLTDDTAARLAAKSMGYRVQGTLGVIVRAVRQGLRTPAEVVALLQTIPDRSSLHIRQQLLQEVITQVQQEYT